MFRIETNIGHFQAEIRKRKAKLQTSSQRAMSAATQSIFATSKNLLTRLVYNKEIPRRPRSKKPRWRRFYALLRGEKWAVSTRGDRGEVFTDPASKAAKPIKNYPGGYGQRRHEKDGRYTKAAPWRAQTHEKGGQRAIDRYRESIEKDLS